MIKQKQLLSMLSNAFVGGVGGVIIGIALALVLAAGLGLLELFQHNETDFGDLLDDVYMATTSLGGLVGGILGGVVGMKYEKRG